MNLVAGGQNCIDLMCVSIPTLCWIRCVWGDGGQKKKKKEKKVCITSFSYIMHTITVNNTKYSVQFIQQNQFYTDIFSAFDFTICLDCNVIHHCSFSFHLCAGVCVFESVC